MWQERRLVEAIVVGCYVWGAECLYRLNLAGQAVGQLLLPLIHSSHSFSG